MNFMIKTISMKERFKTMMFALFAVLASLSLSSCGDDENETKAPNMPSVKMVCTSYSRELHEPYEIFTHEIQYDSKGRVIKYDNITYKYESGMIFTSRNEIYVLSSDGLISKKIAANGSGEGIVLYDYEDGYLVRIHGRDGAPDAYNWYYKWEDGNMVLFSFGVHPDALKEGDSYLIYNYTDMPNVIPSFQADAGRYFDEIDIMLQYCGFFGKRPKNLLKEIVYSENNKPQYIYYDYNEYGYPQSCKFAGSSIKLKWEKL